MGAILGVIGGAVSGLFKGGVIGVAASLIQKWLAGKESKADKDKEIRLAEIALESVKATGNANAIVEAIKANAAAQAASYEHDTKTLDIGKGIQEFFNGETKHRSFWGYLLFGIAFMLDFIRGSLRPFMCYTYTGFSAAVVVYAYYKGWISQIVVEKCAEYTIYAWVETASMIVGWYFGNRYDAKVKRG